MIQKDNFTDLVEFLDHEMHQPESQADGTVSTNDGEYITLSFNDIKYLIQNYQAPYKKQIDDLKHTLAYAQAEALAYKKFNKNP